jgi:hypothetical protein
MHEVTVIARYSAGATNAGCTTVVGTRSSSVPVTIAGATSTTITVNQRVNPAADGFAPQGAYTSSAAGTLTVTITRDNTASTVADAVRDWARSIRRATDLDTEVTAYGVNVESDLWAPDDTDRPKYSITAQVMARST